MKSVKDILKFSLLPKKAYLSYSAHNKYRRADKKGEAELRLLPFLVDKNKYSIDIGANMGLYTYFLSKLSKKVYAFEPHKKLTKFLEKATKNNVTVMNCAVSNNEGEKAFYIPLAKGRKLLNIASLEKNSINQPHYVEETTKTILLDTLKLDNIGFIKIDVEGHELAVLEGAKKTIEKFRPVMLIEVLTKNGKILDTDVAIFMRQYNYEVFCLKDNLLHLVDSLNTMHVGRNVLFLPKDM